LTLQQAATHPQLREYFNTDGSPRLAAIVKAPDAELQKHLGLLSPDTRTQLHQQLSTFKPSMVQSMGARAMGIDVERQRQRMLGLLGQPAAAGQPATPHF
jgi:hypothetical protein